MGESICSQFKKPRKRIIFSLLFIFWKTYCKELDGWFILNYLVLLY